MPFLFRALPQAPTGAQSLTSRARSECTSSTRGSSSPSNAEAVSLPPLTAPDLSLRRWRGTSSGEPQCFVGTTRTLFWLRVRGARSTGGGSLLSAWGRREAEELLATIQSHAFIIVRVCVRWRGS